MTHPKSDKALQRPKYLKYLLTDAEQETMDFSQCQDERDIFRHLIDHDIGLIIDHRGEGETNEILDFVNKRLIDFGKTALNPKRTKIYEAFEEELAKDDPEYDAGGFPAFAFRYLNEKVKRKKMRIVELDTGSDFHAIFVIEGKSLKSLTKLAINEMQFISLNIPHNSMLYVVERCPQCKTGMPAIWDLHIDDPSPMQSYAHSCDYCGMLFWDGKGNVYVEVEQTSHYRKQPYEKISL